MVTKRYAYDPEIITDQLERAVITVLGFRIGKANAIKLRELHYLVAQHGVKVDTRVIRATVQTLRKRGALICSAGGSDGGYWIASGWGEINKFFEDELEKRAFDLLEQKKAMKLAAARDFGPEKTPQIGLGI